MSSVEFEQVFQSARPEQCTCSTLRPAARAAYDHAIHSGDTHEQACQAGLAMIDSACPGVTVNELGSCEPHGCGQPELVCGRREGPKFLLMYATSVRLELVDPT